MACAGLRAAIRSLTIAAALSLGPVAYPPSATGQDAAREPGAKPPSQPKSGPGGADYRHAKVVEASFGDKESRFWIFEPAAPAPEKAPIIVFLHGWSALHPFPYRAWIDHLVRRGNIVVYPQYQELLTPAFMFTPNGVKAVKAAVAELGKAGHVKPDIEKFAVVGHSAGAVGAANLAAVAAAEGLPKPKAMAIVQPGRGAKKADADPVFGIPLADLSKVPADILALVVVGDADSVVGDAVAKDMFRKLRHVPAENRDFVVVRSDDRGKPPLRADHFSPTTGFFSAPDALDYCGYWKLFDALTDAAFFGRNRECALGNTPQQRDMGQWSDGTKVREMVVTKDP